MQGTDWSFVGLLPKSHKGSDLQGTGPREVPNSELMRDIESRSSMSKMVEMRPNHASLE